VWEYKKERNKRNIATCSDLCIDLLLWDGHVFV
jgi:hypothetical protein